MRYFLSILIFFAGLTRITAQENDSARLVSINQRIDDLVVQKNTDSLIFFYAPDFVFSHGSGKIEGRDGWFKSVARGKFISRNHDSVRVFLHQGLATLTGKLSVAKATNTGEDRYHLKYVRFYALRNQRWEMVSHITTWEVHE